MNLDLLPDVLISLIGAVIFGLLIVPTTARWRSQERAIATLSLYLSLGLVWNISLAVQVLGVLGSEPDPFFLLLFDISRSAMPVVFGGLTLAFLNKKKGLYLYFTFGIILLTLWVGIKQNLFDSNDIQRLISSNLSAIRNINQIIPPDIHLILPTLEFFAWTVATLIALWTILASRRQKRQAQFRNRLRYWLGGITLLSTAIVIILLQNYLLQSQKILWLGATLNIVGSSFVTYIVLRSHPPDLHLLTSYLLRKIAVTLVLSIALFGVLYSPTYFTIGIQTIPQNILARYIAIAVGVAIILPPFYRGLENILTRLLLEAGFDESSTIKAYSQSVSTEWDFDKLGRQALTFILQEMKVKRGALFVNEGDGSGHVTLKLIAAIDTPDTSTSYFFADDPWIIHMRQAQTAVTQYDLDLLREYKAMDENSKDWLVALDMEIFFPVILRQRELMGILALGAKLNNRPFLDQDLNRIDVLSAQIAIDINKAKMFNQLGAVNQKIGEMSEKFATLDKGKTDFLSIASHEIRTPLTHIHGYASMLMEATEEELQSPAYLKHIFTGIAKGSNRLKDVVNLIFDVSKADIGEMSLVFDSINLAQVVEKATANQKNAIQQRQHKLVVSGLDQLTDIHADPERLVQALEQLINNAVKYTPDGGIITITGHTITENDQPYVELIVTDTGIGIDPKDHTQIFDKFYRVGHVENHSTSSVKFKGAGPGLGLPLVKGIAQAHGGRVWVESPSYDEETCPGSQFHLITPVEPNIQEVAEAVLSNISPSKAETRHWRGEDIKAIKERIAQQQNK